MIKAFAFDLFGTLVDTTSIIKAFPEVNIKINKNNLKSFIEMWYSKQLQYAWLSTLLNKYEPFSELSKRALIFTAKVYGVELSDENITKLNEAKLHLEAFPGSKVGLEELRNKVTTRKGDEEIKIVVLSNGEEDKTDKVLSNNNIKEYFDHIFSVEEVKKYKPSPEAYRMASEKLNIPTSEISMVSSNLWDIAGAQSVGMQTCWINREDAKTNEELHLKPDNVVVLSSIKDLKGIIQFN
jgi:2-haloacid dehalogenase